MTGLGKKTNLIKTFAFLLFYVVAASAQPVALKLVEGHQMRIEGTSNLRDWDAEVREIEVEFVLADSAAHAVADLRADSFTKLVLQIPVAGIKSGTRGLTGKIHKYIKKDEYPVLAFVLEEVTAIEHKEGVALVTARGMLNAAGKEQQVVLQVSISDGENDLFIVEGNQPLKMTQFGIKPPTAVFGTIKAVDEFSVRFSLSFSR
ncbi:MAG: polyisoprenoid-binding protein YceI [Candidatus Latescibacterota bacterium]|jgi:polyisoprenoid-binding protein YceI